MILNGHNLYDTSLTIQENWICSTDNLPFTLSTVYAVYG